MLFLLSLGLATAIPRRSVSCASWAIDPRRPPALVSPQMIVLGKLIGVMIEKELHIWKHCVFAKISLPFCLLHQFHMTSFGSVELMDKHRERNMVVNEIMFMEWVEAKPPTLFHIFIAYTHTRQATDWDESSFKWYSTKLRNVWPWSSSQYRKKIGLPHTTPFIHRVVLGI